MLGLSPVKSRQMTKRADPSVTLKHVQTLRLPAGIEPHGRLGIVQKASSCASGMHLSKDILTDNVPATVLAMDEKSILFVNMPLCCSIWHSS